MSGLTYPKPKDLSHLVDARIGVPEADQTNQIINGDFANWTGDNPDDWTISGENATNYITEVDGGARFVSDGTAAIQIYQSFLVVGRRYRVDYDIREGAVGGISVGTDTSVTNIVQGDVTAGRRSYLFTATTENIRFKRSAAGTDITIDNIEVYEWNGEELVPDADVGFVANDALLVTNSGNNTVEQDGNAIKITYVDTIAGGFVHYKESKGTVFNDIGSTEKFQLTLRLKVNPGSSVDLRFNYVTIDTITNTEYQEFTYTLTSANTFMLFAIGAGEIIWYETVSIKRVTGLVAAYNMIPSGDTLVDISGEGNNGTISGAVSSNDGLKFNGSRDYIEIPDSSSFDFGYGGITFAWRGTIDVISSPNKYLYASRQFRCYTQSSQKLRFLISDNVNSHYADSDFYVYIPGEEITIIQVLHDRVIMKVYIDGVEIELTRNLDLSTVGSLDFQTNLFLHLGYAGSGYLEGLSSNLQIYNYAFNEQQAKDYHNQFAKQISQRHRFDDLGVGSTI